jgi:hypothetical protein
VPVADAYQDALRQALVGAVPTKLARDRRRAATRRVVVAMALLVAVLGTIVTVTLPDDRADASIEVEVRDGTMFVRLLDVESRPDEIVGELRNAGLDVTIELVPVGPSNIGRFVSMTSTESGIGHVSDSTHSFMSFTVPLGFAGKLRLGVGRRADPGEEWRAPSDATAKDEVLECRILRGLTAAEAAREMADVPASVSWNAVGIGNLEPGAELEAPYPNWRVVDVLSWSDGRVIVSLTETGQWPYLTNPPPQVPPSCKGK